MSAAALALLLVAACQSRTELVIGVATDFAAPDIVDEVRIELSRAGTGVPQLQHSWEIGAGSDFNLPGSYGIYSEDGALPVEIVLTGLKGPTVVVSRRALITLVDGETLFYRMGLTAACRDTSTPCPAGTTCVEGQCQPEELQARKLPTYTDSLVTELTCVSNATYKNTSDGSSMAVSEDANACPGSLCAEGTCLVTPSGARMYRGVCAALPFEMLVDGNQFSFLGGANGTTFTAEGQVAGDAFVATTQLFGVADITVDGTLSATLASGTLTERVVETNRTYIYPFTAFGGDVTGPYCGDVTRSDGDRARVTVIASGGRFIGQFASIFVSEVGTLEGSVTGSSVAFQWSGLGGAGTGTGVIEGDQVSGSFGGSFSGTFTASTAACRGTAGPP